MAPFRILSSAEQVAAHLRRELAAGAWRGEMPGAAALAVELSINHKTVDAALALLEREGLLASRGPRLARRILDSVTTLAPPSLRIALLLRDREDRSAPYLVEARHRLIEHGHRSFFTRQTLVGLGMNVEKVADYVAQTPADVWVVQSAPRQILEWFAAEPHPCFAMFGFFRRLPVAGSGPDKAPVYVEVVERLVGLGHRRIVLLARSQRRYPRPGYPERQFLRALGAAGIEAGDYHFPYWEETREGFHRCLESLFMGSPPSALLVQEPVLFAAVQQFLAARGIRVPQDVSLVCDDPNPSFAWQIPTVAHIHWEAAPCIRRLVRWAENSACGKDDHRHALVKARFVDGGTVGPPPSISRRK
jgi:hypothetical protein